MASALAETDVAGSAKKITPNPAAATPPAAPPRVYNAIYSAVQVYECMVRGIAVMRRRVDSYVNATQILKVAGIDKGRRTKILEKEILPGKHEIVQGGYGKYQGTWIPLERGREIAGQFGVAPLLAPLFDYVPATHNVPRSGVPSPAVPRPFYSPQGIVSPHFGSPGGMPFHGLPNPHLAPPRSPFLPQSFPPLLNSTTTPKGGVQRTQNIGNTPQLHTAYLYPGSPNPYSSPRPLVNPLLKRPREESVSLPKKESAENRPTPNTPVKTNLDIVKQPPTKRPRTNSTPAIVHNASRNSPSPPVDVTHKQPKPSRVENNHARPGNPPMKSTRHRSIITSITRGVETASILQQLRDDDPAGGLDVILDDQGHTAMHFAASVSRVDLVQALAQNGANICHANTAGETPLMRCVLSVSSFEAESFPHIIKELAGSVRMADSSSRSVLHHIALVAGVKERLLAAQYYMDSTLEFLALTGRDDVTFPSFINMRDVHGDTALNLAARIGNRTLVRNLRDVGADPDIANKLGLTPKDFGVMTEIVETDSIMADGFASSSSDPLEPQKGKEIISQLASLVHSLGAQFSETMSAKRNQFETQKMSMRSAAVEVAAQRRELRQLKSRSNELDSLRQRIRSLRGVGEEDLVYNWSSSLEPKLIAGVSELTPPPVEVEDTKNRTTSSKDVIDPERVISITTVDNDVSVDIPLPIDNTFDSLKQLRKIKTWYNDVENRISERIGSLVEKSIEKELQCKRLVSICTATPLDKVDQMLDHLITSLESEGSSPEIARITMFMQRVGAGTTTDV